MRHFKDFFVPQPCAMADTWMETDTLELHHVNPNLDNSLHCSLALDEEFWGIFFRYKLLHVESSFTNLK
jgi:hypothetical protein